MKLVALLRSTETRELTGEGTTYAEAREVIEQQVTECWAVSSYRDVTDAE